jgi:hypothetical protein
VLVGDQLDLNVARLLDVLLQQDAVVRERVLGLRLGQHVPRPRLLVRVRDAHALAAAACDREGEGEGAGERGAWR